MQTIPRNVTIDWTVKESVKANLRRLVKRLLRQYGYPPEKQEKAMVTVLQQAELLCRDWAALRFDGDRKKKPAAIRWLYDYRE